MTLRHYVINFVSELWKIGDILRVLQFTPPLELTALI